MKNSSSGFTLVEFLIAISLFSMVMAAMYSVLVVSLNRQTRTMGEMMVNTNSLTASSMIRRMGAAATYIQHPDPAGACPALPAAATFSLSPDLIIWQNLKPIANPDGTRDPYSPGDPVTGYWFCMPNKPPNPGSSDPASTLLMYTVAGYDNTFPTFACGAAPPAGATMTVLAGGPSNQLNIYSQFIRPCNANNVFRSQLTVTLTKNLTPDATLKANQAQKETDVTQIEDFFVSILASL